MVATAVLWPDFVEQALRDFVTAKAGSATKIAELMTERFGTSFTRNMICGKIARMGLTTADANAKAGRDTKPKRIRGEKTYRKPALPPNLPKLRCVEVTPRNLSLFDLEPGDCRWPYGEGPFTFCGHPKFGDSSYCAPHIARSIGLGTASERAAA